MASSFSNRGSLRFGCVIWMCAVLLFSVALGGGDANFYTYYNMSWGDEHGKILENGQLVTLTLDRFSGAGFESIKEYLFGTFKMDLKLVSGNSAGTVTTFYLSSKGKTHDEIDFEFLGNVSGQPYTLHTNVFAQGKGNREQQFKLWFDPTADFHSYAIRWNPQFIIFIVDGIPIRKHDNQGRLGIPFPSKQPMRIYSSLWNGEEWATRGGLVKTDWSKAPFVAYYRKFSVIECAWSNGGRKICPKQDLDAMGRKWVRWVRKYHTVYDYCTDTQRFANGLPPECSFIK